MTYAFHKKQRRHLTRLLGHACEDDACVLNQRARMAMQAWRNGGHVDLDWIYEGGDVEPGEEAYAPKMHPCHDPCCPEMGKLETEGELVRTGKHLTLAHSSTINAIEVGRIRTMALAEYGITSMHCTDL